MLHDVFEAGWIPFDRLDQAIKTVKEQETYEPTVLVVSHDMFDRYVNAIGLHPTGTSVGFHLRKVGITNIIWGTWLKKDHEFELTSERSLQNVLKNQPDLEMLILTAPKQH